MRVAALVSAVRTALRARRRQYELRSLLEGLRDADQRKTEFLATLAHELRNPLAPLGTALSLLSRKKPPPDEAVKYYELMSRQVEHMVRLVNDLMEVSRITRGKIELHLGPVLLDAVIEDAIELSRPLFDRAGHSLTLELGADPLVVRGDAVRLTQVFSNLLNNAAKYTPTGGRVTVTARQEGRQAVVAVRDTGTGLAPDMLKSIFEMFVQVSGTARDAQGGLGIGLTLVKSLVELHGGSIEARSEGADRGSEFVVRLPIAVATPLPAAAPPKEDEEPKSATKCRILIVDDNQDSADSLAMLLKIKGYEVATAYDGEQAVEAAGTLRPDVVLLDIGMPKLNGYDACWRIRQQPWGQGMFLIALTGWGQEEDRRRTEEAGFNEHIVKPVDPAALMKLLASLSAEQGAQLSKR
jgi:CheY-like chemotaxis protein/nitrogen-specific signal transduction histidine kinase